EGMMRQVITRAGLRDDLIRLGLGADPAASGDVSSTTRRRIALVRGLIKRPRLIVLDGIAGSGTEADARLRAGIRAEAPDATILYAALEDGAAGGADLVARIAPDGTVEAEAPQPAGRQTPAPAIARR
ncbi:MAG TPA: hypothetical protein VFJ13_02585, partial [Paracoccaceae bacterium]|nr:hypothetical protein [Paracoccaceae bacterium]